MVAPVPVHLIEKLISFDTVSRNSNMALLDFVRDYLGKLGVEAKLVPNEDGSKANLYATIGPVSYTHLTLPTKA